MLPIPQLVGDMADGIGGRHAAAESQEAVFRRLSLWRWSSTAATASAMCGSTRSLNTAPSSIASRGATTRPVDPAARQDLQAARCRQVAFDGSSHCNALRDADVLDTLRRIWHVRPATARRVRQRINS